MWDNLNSSAAKVTATFFRENGPIYFSGCYVGLFGQIFVNETFVVAKIQVSLCTIIRNEHFTVLYRIHSTGIDIDIRVEFLHGHTITTHFQKSAQRCGCNSFAETGHNTTSDEDIFDCHLCILLCVRTLLSINKPIFFYYTLYDWVCSIYFCTKRKENSWKISKKYIEISDFLNIVKYCFLGRLDL